MKSEDLTPIPNPIQIGEIELSPGATVCVGTEVTLALTDVVDFDTLHYCIEDNKEKTKLDADTSLTTYWTVMKDGEVYDEIEDKALAPSEPLKFTPQEPGKYKVKVYVDDKWPPPVNKNRNDKKSAKKTATITVIKVNLDHDIWWFNGEDAANYDETGTLTAQGATTGTFKWDVIAGANKVDLNNGGADADSITATDDNTVVVKSTDASMQPNDVTVQLTYNGIAVCEVSLSVFAPASLQMETGFPKYEFKQVGIGPTTVRRWKKTFKFRVLNQFSAPLTKPIEGNEQFGTRFARNPPDENWPPDVAYGVLGPNGTLTDIWKIVSFLVKINPDIENRTTLPEGQITVYKVPHEYRIGSVTPGKGRLVQRHTMNVKRGEPVIENITFP